MCKQNFFAGRPLEKWCVLVLHALTCMTSNDFHRSSQGDPEIPFSLLWLHCRALKATLSVTSQVFRAHHDSDLKHWWLEGSTCVMDLWTSSHPITG